MKAFVCISRFVAMFVIAVMCFVDKSMTQDFTSILDTSICWSADMVVQTGSLPSQSAVIRGGREITTEGTLRTLVIFVRFADDTYEQSLWPDYTELPTWASSIVDPEIPQGNIFTSMNMSDFFDRASGGDGDGNIGALHVIGDVYYVETDEDRSFYEEDPEAVNEHVLTKLGQNGVHYSEYDNWTFMKDGQLYNHENEPDGIVDYIWIIWRGYSPKGLTNLGVKNLHADITLDGTQITPSSGSTQFRYSYYDSVEGDISIGGPYDQKPLAILTPSHEFTHYIFGGSNITGHINGRIVYGGIPNIGNVSFFTFMTSTSNAPFSAYERYRAGWLNPDIIETDMSSVQLKDTHIENKAIMIPVRRDANNEIREYFLLENFQTRNDYATANPFTRRYIFNHTLQQGVLVFHIEDEDLSLPANSNLDISCADGLWQWNLSAGQSTQCNRCDDHIFRDVPSPNSSSGVYDERDVIYLQVESCLNEYWATNTVGACTGWYTKDAILGDNQDFFRVGETDVLSRWSNPSSIRADLTVVDKAFELASYNSSTREYTLKAMVTYNGALGLKPSKPQNLRVTLTDGDTHPMLTWTANSEPDVNSSGKYFVEERIKLGSWGNWFTADSVSGSTTEWIDYAICNAGSGSDRIEYRIRARDTQQKLSVYSDVVGIPWTGADCVLKPVPPRGGLVSVPKAFALQSSYPNPFNPATRIQFELPNDCYVSLIVHDVLGREVGELVREYREAGYHSATWNAKNHASGVYFVRLEVSSLEGKSAYTKINKLVLMK